MTPIPSKTDALDAIVERSKSLQIGNFIIQIIGFLFIAFSINYMVKEPISCTQKDIWQTSEWSSCSIDGIRTRKVYENTGTLSCDKKELVQKPESVERCDFVSNGIDTPIIPNCEEGKDVTIGKWSSCNASGQTLRTIVGISDRAKAGICKLPETEDRCIPDVKNKVSLFGKNGFKSDVLNAYGRNNIDNISLSFSGKFDKIYLTFTTETRKADGTIIQSSTSAIYFPMFRLPGGQEVLRVLGTDRLANGNIDNDSSKQPGIFRSSDTPKTLIFDMSNMKLAKSKTVEGGIGSITKNYIKDTINNRTTDKMNMTLYILSDGKSLYDADSSHRIDAVITEAYLEYTCDNETPKCSIKSSENERK